MTSGDSLEMTSEQCNAIIAAAADGLDIEHPDSTAIAVSRLMATLCAVAKNIGFPRKRLVRDISEMWDSLKMEPMS